MLVATIPVAFSAWTDPSRLLGAPAAERAIAAALLDGHHVTNVMNYDERAVAKLVAQRQPRRPDILALGSSRIQVLRTSDFPGQRFVNAGVSAGRLDDVLGLYALYDDSVHRPRRVVLNLDPLSLDDDLSNALWGSLAVERANMLTRIGVSNSLLFDRLRLRFAQLLRLVSPEYFRLAMHSFRQFGARGLPFVVTDTAQNINKTKAPSGTLVWSRTTPLAASVAVRSYVADLTSLERQQLFLAGSAGRRRADVLEKFLRHLRGEGVDVTVVLVPYHPDAYAAWSRRPAATVQFAERLYREVADRAGVEVVGSYDPSASRVTARDLFDQEHLIPDALARLLVPRK